MKRIPRAQPRGVPELARALTIGSMPLSAHLGTLLDGRSISEKPQRPGNFARSTKMKTYQGQGFEESIKSLGRPFMGQSK